MASWMTACGGGGGDMCESGVRESYLRGNDCHPEGLRVGSDVPAVELDGWWQVKPPTLES